MSKNNKIYLSIKKDYHDIINLHNQTGGVRPCNTNNPNKQFMYNFWGRIIELLRANYANYSATRGETLHPNATCNLWIWHKNHQIYNLTNHMDIYLLNSTQIGIKFTKQVYDQYGRVITNTSTITFNIPDINTYDRHYIVNDMNSPYNGIDPMPIIAEIIDKWYQQFFGNIT